MQNFQDTFETRKQSFISAFSICITVPCCNFLLFRSIHQRCSIKKAVLKNFAIFIRKHLRWSLFLIKLQASKHATLLKRDSNIDIFM